MTRRRPQSSPETKKANQWQFGVEKGQFDGVFEKKVAVRYASDSDQKIQQHEEVAEPQASAYACGVHYGGAQGF